MLSRKNNLVFLIRIVLISIGIIIAISPITARSDSGGGTGPGGVGTTNGTSNLVLWLDAASITQSGNTPISVWADKSGYGNDANQPTILNQPAFITDTINGQPVVRFDGLQNYLIVSDTAYLDNTAGLTIFAVTNPSNLDFGSPLGLISKRHDYQDQVAYSLFFLSGNYLFVDIDTYAATPDDRFSTDPFAYQNGVTNIIELLYDGSLPESYRSKIYDGGSLIKTAAESSASIAHYNQT